MKVVRTGVKRVLIDSKIENATGNRSKACSYNSKIENATGNKGNFESGQNRSKACSYRLEDRECNWKQR